MKYFVPTTCWILFTFIVVTGLNTFEKYCMKIFVKFCKVYESLHIFFKEMQNRNFFPVTEPP